MQVVFVDLQTEVETLRSRVQNRKEHYICAEMVEEQARSHEPVEAEEVDVLPIDAELGSQEMVAEVRMLLGF